MAADETQQGKKLREAKKAAATAAADEKEKKQLERNQIRRKS